MQRPAVWPRPADGAQLLDVVRGGSHSMAEAAGEHVKKDHTMTKADLVEEVTRITELPRKEAEAVVETIFESIIGALQSDDKIEIRGFRIAPGAKVEVPPKKIPFFKPSKELKDCVNHPRPGGAPAGSSGPGT